MSILYFYKEKFISESFRKCYNRSNRYNLVSIYFENKYLLEIRKLN